MGHHDHGYGHAYVVVSMQATMCTCAMMIGMNGSRYNFVHGSGVWISLSSILQIQRVLESSERATKSMRYITECYEIDPFFEDRAILY